MITFPANNKKYKVIAVDFDGTIAKHEYPYVGEAVPNAFEWLKEFQRRGAKLILWTMRSHDDKHGDVLQEAIDFCKSNGVEFWGVNRNPEQDSWTSSHKAYAHAYIDDAAIGCPLVQHGNSRPFVDWSRVGPMVLRDLQL